MMWLRSRQIARFTALLAALLFSVAAAALEKGEFRAGLYTAPGQTFTVKSPLGPNQFVIDSFDRAAGAVTFIDETGALYGVICTPNFDVLAGANNDYETDVAILRNWLHDATFPLFFGRQLPGAAIVHEEATTFEGGPAWVGVVHLPRGSSLIRNDPVTGYPTRLDSVRGLVVFTRGEHTYLLMMETSPGEPWNSFLPTLTKFYHGMAFSMPPPAPGDSRLAEVRNPGT